LSWRIIVKEAHRRREIFSNLEKWLGTIHETVKEIDPKAEAYLFGSVAEKRHNLSSDIDILITTEHKPEEIITKLWKRGIKNPFEIHVIKPSELQKYKQRSKLINLAKQ